jgi:hypothetical protein
MALEELDSAFVLLSRGSRAERAQIATPSSFWIDFPRVQPVFAGRKLPNHCLRPSLSCKKSSAIKSLMVRYQMGQLAQRPFAKSSDRAPRVL